MGEFRSDYQRLAGYGAIILFLLPGGLFAYWLHIANAVEPVAAARAVFLEDMPSFLQGMGRVSTIGVISSGMTMLLAITGMGSFGRFMRFILTLVLLASIAVGIVYLFWLM